MKNLILRELECELPALEESAEGLLKGGFCELSVMSANVNDNGTCGDNITCQNNESCFGNRRCNNNRICDDNSNCVGPSSGGGNKEDEDTTKAKDNKSTVALGMSLGF